jgi:predicted transcriptional regulator
MDRLMKKGMLERTEVEGTYVYRSKFESDKMERRLVESFIEHRLGGSLQPIVNFLSAKENFTAEEIAQIRSLVEKLEA